MTHVTSPHSPQIRERGNLRGTRGVKSNDGDDHFVNPCPQISFGREITACCCVNPADGRVVVVAHKPGGLDRIQSSVGSGSC